MSRFSQPNPITRNRIAKLKDRKSNVLYHWAMKRTSHLILSRVENREWRFDVLARSIRLSRWQYHQHLGKYKSIKKTKYKVKKVQSTMHTKKTRNGEESECDKVQSKQHNGKKEKLKQNTHTQKTAKKKRKKVQKYKKVQSRKYKGWGK